LLPVETQELFSRLSVFAGGFFAENVAEVCETTDAVRELGILTKYSLLIREESLGRKPLPDATNRS